MIKKHYISTRFFALLMAITCVIGIFPITASATAPETITLDNCNYPGIAYTSDALGKCVLQEIRMNYEDTTIVGFCGNHGMGMGTSLIGQTWTLDSQITDPVVTGMMAYYYCHTQGRFTDKCISMGLNTVWNSSTSQNMNALVQAILWRYLTDNFSDPVAACAEEWMNIVNFVEGAHYTDIDEEHDGVTFRNEMSNIIDLARQGVWGECEVSIYNHTGKGSSAHPVGTIQRIVIGKLKITNQYYNIIIKKVDRDNPNFGLAGAKFHIESENGSYKRDVVTGADGTVTLLELSAATYAITETGAPEDYEIDDEGPQYVVLPNSNNETTVTVTFKDSKTITSTGTIRKVDADNTSKGLKGAVIKIEGVDNPFVGTYTTDSDGYLADVPWEDMAVGSYSATEITPPSGYTIDGETKKQNFYWNGKTDVALTFADHAKVKVQLIKQDDSGRPLANVLFNVLKDGQVIMSATTDASGKITVPNAVEGLYAFVELAAPTGYARLESPVFAYVNNETVTGGGTVTVTAVNKKLPNLTITKIDAQTGETIPGTVFSVKGIQFGYTATVTTGANGTVTLTGVPVDSYEVTEVSVPEPYVLGEDSTQTLFLGAGANGTLTFKNVKKPCLKIVKYDAQTGKALSDTTFEVFRNTAFVGAYTTDVNGEIRLYDLTPGTYLVREVATQSGYVVNSTPQEIELEAGYGDYTLVFRNYVKPGVRLVKLDSQTMQPLANVRFRLTRIGGNFSKEYITDINGEIDVSALDEGSYTVEELAAPTDYLIDDAIRTIEIKGGENAEFVFNDTKKPTMEIVKYDAEGKKLLPGAAFRIAKIEDGAHYLDRITDENGRITITDLEPGVYSVSEIAAPAGYVLDETDYHVQLYPGQTSQLVVRNEARPDLRILKYDAQTKKPLSGTTFEVYRDTALIGEYTTDASGEIVLYDLDPGTYLVKEVSTLDSHVVNSTPQEIELKAGNTFTYSLVFLNYVKPGIHLVKLDSQTLVPLANAKFRIERVGGNLSKEYITDINGEIDVSTLDEGSYTVTELAAPEGYLIDDATRTIEIKGGEYANFVFTNTKKPTLKLVKLDSLTGNTLPGTTFRIAKIEDGSRYLDRITDADGEINIADLETGVYSVLELAAPEGYVRNPVEYHVELFPSRESRIVVSNDHKPDLKIIKRDADTGATLAGAVFKVSKADGSTLTTETTNENGEIVLTGLNPGVYQITEVTPPVGYLPAEEPTQLITLVPNKLGTVIFENHLKPSITINKVDSITGDPIGGVKFHISYASNNTFTGEVNDLGDYYTDENGQIKIYDLRDGWYRVTEIEPAAGYSIIEPATQELYISAGTGKTLTFENTPLSALVVYKYDSVTGAAAEGAVFNVRYLSGTSGTGGTVIGTYRTSANGSFTVTNLKAGAYVVEEVASDSGHIIDAAPQTAYISGKEQDIVTLYFGNAPKGSLLIKKIDAATHAPLSDVEFAVTTSEGTVIGNANGKYVTDSTGSVLISGLDPNMTVVVKETRTKARYVLDDVPQTVKIKSGETVSVEFRNAPNGGLIIRKFDADTKKPLAGAVFEVKTADGRYVDNYGGLVSTLGRYTTGADGQIMLHDLTPGSYVISEVMAPAGYQLDTVSKAVQVNSNDTQVIDFYDSPNGSLLIKKIDAATHAPLSDVQFYVTDSTGAIIGDGYYTTDSAGTFLIDGITPGTTLIVKETAAKSGYVLDDVAQTAVIKSGETVTLEFRNVLKGSLIVQKYDSITKLPLTGAEFKITTASGELVATNEGMTSSNGLYVTDEHGQIVLSKLNPDTYIVTETRAPDYYKPDATPQTVAVNGADTQTLYFYNKPYCTLTVYKRDSETKKLLPNAEFTVTYGDGEIIGHYTTDHDGKFTVSGLKPDTTVIVTEDKAPTGYVKDATPKTIVVRSDTANSLTFDNESTTTLVIRKYIEGTDYEPLSGVAFKVTDGSGGAVGSDDGVYYTDKAGEIALSDLTPGMTVIAREIKTVDGFVLDGTPQDIEIKAGTVQNLTFWNARQGSLVIQKYDSVTKAPLTGVEFSIRYAEGRVVDNIGGKISSNGQYFTDANGRITITGVTGTLVVTEVATIEGYTIDPATRTQTVTVNPDDTQTLVFYNTPQGGLIITKSDEETGARISGVMFEVRKLNGEIIGTYTTDRNGVIRLPGLEKGWYSVTELKAASGYKLDATPQAVEVKDGRTTTLALTNRKTSNILIHKVDADTGKGIYGATFILYDASRNPIGQYTSDQSGNVYMDDGLADGRYYLREIRAADGYILDEELKTIYVQYGSTSEIVWKNTAIRGQIQIIKKSADDNPINGLPAGTLLEGAVFEIYDKAGNVVDTVRTDRNGRAASKLLPLSHYTVREVSAPSYYSVNPTVMTAYLEYTGQIVTFEVLDESISTGVSIKKTGYAEVMSGQPIRYTMTGIANTSTVPLSSFYWRDTLPGQITLTQLVTGTYNQQLNYKVVYKTNLSGDSYRTLADNLSTSKNYVLDASPATLRLAANERITEIMYVFGTVKAGFAQVETPYIYGTVNKGLANGTSIVNVADVGGIYNGQWVQAVARWNTTVYAKTTVTMPKTGY